jgi:hypothetical protein
MGPEKTFTNYGQVGAMGENPHAHDMTLQQVQGGGLDLAKLAEELGRLRGAMKREPDGPPEQDEAVGAVAAAERAAKQGDQPTVLQHLRTAGTWTLGIAEKIGVPLAVEALKRGMM